MTNLITRVSTVATIVLGSLFFSCNFEASNIVAMLILVTLLITSGFISYRGLKNKSENEIKSMFGLTWLENKMGINFIEE